MREKCPAQLQDINRRGGDDGGGPCGSGIGVNPETIASSKQRGQYCRNDLPGTEQCVVETSPLSTSYTSSK